MYKQYTEEANMYMFPNVFEIKHYLWHGNGNLFNLSQSNKRPILRNHNAAYAIARD